MSNQDKKKATAPTTEQAGAGPIAWMNLTTSDIIHAARKKSWIEDFGIGGKAKAASYTIPLYAAPGGEAPATAPAEAPEVHPDTKRLAWMADGWTPGHEAEYVKHVLQVGGDGGLEDMRVFVDRQIEIDAGMAEWNRTMAAQSQKGAA